MLIASLTRRQSDLRLVARGCHHLEVINAQVHPDACEHHLNHGGDARFAVDWRAVQNDYLAGCRAMRASQYTDVITADDHIV